MKKTWKIAAGVAVVAGIGGTAWAVQSGILPFGQKPAATTNPAPVAVTADGKAINPDTHVNATEGKKVTLGLANHSSSDVQLTIPGLYDTPLPVQSGASSHLDFVAATPGTYTIIEHGTMPNTRSSEGGTSGYDMEIGKVEVAPN
jgi:hypothetical protein